MKFICLMGRSGSGKSKVESALEKFGYKRSISYTTREPRENEQNGVDYYFVTKEKFLDLVEKDIIIEYEEHYGNYYGTQAPFGAMQYVGVLGLGGIRALKERYGKQIISIYLECDESVAIDRLRNRGDSEDKLNERINTDNSLIDEMKSEADFSVRSDNSINIVLADIFKKLNNFK